MSIPTTSADPYRMAHGHVRATRGRADSHDCVDCGQRAEEWSLDTKTIGTTPVVAHERRAGWSGDHVVACIAGDQRVGVRGGHNTEVLCSFSFCGYRVGLQALLVLAPRRPVVQCRQGPAAVAIAAPCPDGHRGLQARAGRSEGSESDTTCGAS